MLKEIRNFDGYFISDDGRVFCNLGKGRRRDLNANKRTELYEVKQRLTRTGYARVYIRNSATNKRQDKYIHRLVAEYFLPNPENKNQVDHINCIRNDNRVENLRWVTNKENSNHTMETKHLTRDSQNGRYVGCKFEYQKFC